MDQTQTVDYLTKRPRTPNTRYTELTHEQLCNIKNDPHPFFHCSKPDGPPIYGDGREGGRFYNDRYAMGIASEHNVRGPSLSQPFMYITEKHIRDPPAEHNSSRLGAASTWGPGKAGERTMRHFIAEDKNDYGMIDCLRRHPTNQPGNIIFKYGRPHHGYYAQKNPSMTTWFDSSCPMNEASIMVVPESKTVDMYKAISEYEQAKCTQSPGAEWPGFTEYTDRYLLHSKTESALTGLETKEQYEENSSSKTGTPLQEKTVRIETPADYQQSEPIAVCN
ncbi:uncharacterized protein LOC141909038 [Tubulanus polymorphus]|uniref:uncharacterized protein LOC141909038 n=1 Tax=Tubulanus polymorphus TaxID=672921 RepID=UPI003DA4C47C